MVGTLGPGIGVGRAARFRYVATAGQTTFSGADASSQHLTLNYTPGYLEVAVDGIWLTPDEYTATDGSSIVFSPGLAVGRVVYAYALSVMSVANTYDKSQNGGDIINASSFKINLGINQGTLIAPAVNLDTVLTPGFYACTDATCTNGPYASGQWYITITNLNGDPNYTMQTAYDLIGTGRRYTRIRLAGTWQPWIADRQALPTPGALFGCTMSTVGASTTLTVGAGFAADSTNTRLMQLVSAMAKTTSAWALGTAAGGLDTSTIANSTWYHFYLIQRLDTGVVDVTFSLNATTPALPANYTLYRRIGSMKTNGSGQWTSFTQVNDTFLWAASVVDTNNIATTAARVNTTLTVPTGVVVTALFRGNVQGISGQNIIYTSLLENDQAPSTGVLADIVASGINSSGNIARLTNTSAQIGVRSNAVGSTQTIQTYGWIDDRGKMS